MQFACVFHDGRHRVGVVAGDVLRLMPPQFEDVTDIIAHGARLPETVDAVALANADLRSPVRKFRRDVLCTGWNYWDHFEEGIGKREGQEVERPVAPTFFNKSPSSIIGPREPIAFDPAISRKWDYEGEIALVIGREGRSIPSSRAWEHIFGFLIANDVSQRDLQRRHGGQWFKGKSIDASTPLGPYVTTRHAVDFTAIRLTTYVNGERRQDASVRQMAFDVPALIAELSFGMTLYPGDVILTGTPSGIGMAKKPPIFLKGGDEIVVRATGLGELRNVVTAVNLAGDTDLRLWSDE